MIAEFGLWFTVLALLTCVFQASYFIPAWRNLLLPSLQMAPLIQAVMIMCAFVVLIILRLENDFSVANVVSHSNLTLPTLYKITGAWGNHEGSMLLWALVLALFGAVFSLREAESEIKHLTLATQAVIALGVLLFILFTSNPFERIFPPMADGQALNPLLQDVALAIHPPLLYLGYVGFSIVFSLAVAALLVGRLDKDWAVTAHKWILFSWASLTLGIGLGSWWAYRELGWGGWWFWDPVENASLLPWLSGTALLHSNIVLKKRGMLGVWVVLLSILTFSLSLLGTFLVRSGALTSVHSFASDPTRGLFILAYIAVIAGGALFLFAMRAANLSSRERMLPFSREGMIVINNLFILTACATVLLGTMYPLFVEWIQGSKLTVGAPYFNATFLPLMALPLLFAGLTGFIPWRRGNIGRVTSRTMPAILATLASVFLVIAFVQREMVIAMMGFGLASWLIFASMRWLRGTAKSWPVFMGHVGAAIMLIGITGSSLWKEELQTNIAINETIKLAGYEVVYKNHETVQTGNYEADRAGMAITKAGEMVDTLYPEHRIYTITSTETNEVAIYSTLWQDLYLAVGKAMSDDKRIALRVYYIPMISFIWGGFMLMALGGFWAIWRRPRNTYG